MHAACERLQETILIKAAMEFLRMGLQMAELMVRSPAAIHFCHKRGAGEQPHLAICSPWLQQAARGGIAQVRRVVRECCGHDESSTQNQGAGEVEEHDRVEAVERGGVRGVHV